MVKTLIKPMENQVSYKGGITIPIESQLTHSHQLVLFLVLGVFRLSTVSTESPEKGMVPNTIPNQGRGGEDGVQTFFIVLRPFIIDQRSLIL